MQVTTLVQGLMLVFGLGLGALVPRGGVRLPLFSRELLVNVGTAALLFPLRVGLTLVGVRVAHDTAPGLTGAVDMAGVSVPWLQFLFCLLCLDFAKYWLHRADHRISWLWLFHRVHHSTEHIDASAGLRMHAVDFLKLSAVPVLLFGFLFDVSTFSTWVLPAAISVGIIADTFSHMHVEFPYENRLCRSLLYVFNNPLFHSWHHTRDAVLCDGNYANALPVWDVLFGSNVTRPQPPELYGIEGDQRLEEGVVSLQLLRPRRS
jgi:sterol desaturase/sphingolipid hydroxylase (fatty acid hydroxylase superfamily)